MLKVRISDAEVANQLGEYKNFTGIIEWKGTKGQVQNATFKLSNEFGDLDIAWYNGTWKNGTWEKGLWKNGTWENGEVNGKQTTEPPKVPEESEEIKKEKAELIKKVSKELASLKLRGELPEHTKKSDVEYFSWFTHMRGAGLYMNIDYDDFTLEIGTENGSEKVYDLRKYRSAINAWKRRLGN